MELKEPSAAERAAHLTLHYKSGISEGDTVKVLRKAKSYEMGWQNTWVYQMDTAIGKRATVVRNGGEVGFRLGFKGDDCDYFDYPFYVLELVRSGPVSRKVDLGNTSCTVTAHKVVFDKPVSDLADVHISLIAKAFNEVKKEEVKSLK